MRKITLCAAVALCAAIPILTTAPTRAQEATEAERIYAELATLSPEEREKRLIEGARAEGELNVISTLRGSLTRDEIAMFQAAYPFITVNASESGSQDAAERLLAEETAGRHLTDVVGLGVPDMEQLIARDILASYPTPATDSIREEYRKLLAPENRWTLFSVSEHGIVYNTNLVAPEDVPTTWDDLCDPKFKGTISFEPLEIRFLYGLYVMMGDEKMQEWLQCIAANEPIIQRGHTQRLQLMLAGDHAITPDQYFYNGYGDKQDNPSLPFGIPEKAPVLIYGQANVINKNTPHPYAAALFVDWHLGKEFQTYLAEAPRGPVTVPSPYIPEGAELIVYDYGTSEIYDKVADYWRKYVEK